MPVVEIEILGRRYALQSDRPPEHLHAVAAFVNDRLMEVSGGRPYLVQRDHAILAALNIASELFLLKDRSESLARSLDARVGSLLAIVDRA